MSEKEMVGERIQSFACVMEFIMEHTPMHEPASLAAAMIQSGVILLQAVGRLNQLPEEKTEGAGINLIINLIKETLAHPPIVIKVVDGAIGGVSVH